MYWACFDAIIPDLCALSMSCGPVNKANGIQVNCMVLLGYPEQERVQVHHPSCEIGKTKQRGV
jgi:hypothetical protein